MEDFFHQYAWQLAFCFKKKSKPWSPILWIQTAEAQDLNKKISAGVIFCGSKSGPTFGKGNVIWCSCVMWLAVCWSNSEFLQLVFGCEMSPSQIAWRLKGPMCNWAAETCFAQVDMLRTSVWALSFASEKLMDLECFFWAWVSMWLVVFEVLLWIFTQKIWQSKAQYCHIHEIHLKHVYNISPWPNCWVCGYV